VIGEFPEVDETRHFVMEYNGELKAELRIKTIKTRAFSNAGLVMFDWYDKGIFRFYPTWKRFVDSILNQPVLYGMVKKTNEKALMFAFRLGFVPIEEQGREILCVRVE